MGFYAPPQPNQMCELNCKNLFYILTQIVMLVPIAGFFIFKAESAYEYSTTAYMALTLASVILQLIIFLYKTESFRNLIGNYEQFIEKRERHFDIFLGRKEMRLQNFHNFPFYIFSTKKQGMEYRPKSVAMYMELNANIELVYKWIHFVLAEVDVVGITLPLLLLSNINYFIFDLGSESFVLPWPML